MNENFRWFPNLLYFVFFSYISCVGLKIYLIQDAQDCYIESPQKLSLSSSNEDLPIRSNKIMNKHSKFLRNVFMEPFWNIICQGFNDDDEGYFSRKVSVESTQSTASTTSDDLRSSTSSNMSGESEQSGPPNGKKIYALFQSIEVSLMIIHRG